MYLLYASSNCDELDIPPTLTTIWQWGGGFITVPSADGAVGR